jgi:4-hydroxy-4-methyl-2-oxoglutarate aldolase
MRDHIGPADDSLLLRLGSLDACAVSDALDSLGVAGAAIGVHSVTGRRKIVGRAVTVDLVEAGSDIAKSHLGTAAIDASGPGDVIVVAHHGRLHVGGWGGVLSAGAVTAQVEGVVVDGAVRDLDEAIDFGLALYARTSVTVTARGRVVERGWNIDIQFGGVQVQPGDYVIADHSGVVFIPAARAGEVISRAQRIVDKERSMIQRARRGTPMVDVMNANYESMLTEGQLDD